MPCSSTTRAAGAALPFPAASFDAAILMHSLAHRVQPERAIDEVRRILRPGARLGIVTPNLDFVSACRQRPPGRCRRYRPDPTVERHFDAAAVGGLLERHGMVILTCEPFRRPIADGLRAMVRERILAVAEQPGDRSP